VGIELLYVVLLDAAAVFEAGVAGAAALQVEVA
jgi:hypothetical protein